ncbi:MAG: hypothetical protein ACXWUZ_03990 [Allosphingosinicella sp.]
MATKPKLTTQDIERARRIVYHHVDCGHLAGIRISLTEEGQKHKRELAILGISSKEPIRAGLKAVDASPFKTVFVVDEKNGLVLFALTKNDEYVALAKKKKPKPPTGPSVPPLSDCCRLCAAMGGTSCQPLSDGSCICFGATRQPVDAGPDDPLDQLR